MKKNLMILGLALIVLVGGFTQVSQVIETMGAVSPTVGNMVLYLSSVNTATNPYARFYNTQKDQLWDENATAMGTGAAVTWANSAVTLTDWSATRGGKLVPVDAAITTGWYFMTVYDNVAPASSDTLLLGRHVYIQNGNIQSLDDL